jgi:hypothetical protein
MLDVREHQLLMLLLVVDAERGDEQDLVVAHLRREQLPHVLIDVLAITQHLLHRRTRQQAALRPRVHEPNSLVVGVEQVFVVGIKRLVAAQRRLQQELFEEPARVREVPFEGARVRHALHDVVFALERRANAHRRRAYAAVTR